MLNPEKERERDMEKKKKEEILVILVIPISWKISSLPPGYIRVTAMRMKMQFAREKRERGVEIFIPVLEGGGV